VFSFVGLVFLLLSQRREGKGLANQQTVLLCLSIWRYLPFKLFLYITHSFLLYVHNLGNMGGTKPNHSHDHQRLYSRLSTHSNDFLHPRQFYCPRDRQTYINDLKQPQTTMCWDETNRDNHRLFSHCNWGARDGVLSGPHAAVFSLRMRSPGPQPTAAVQILSSPLCCVDVSEFDSAYTSFTQVFPCESCN